MIFQLWDTAFTSSWQLPPEPALHSKRTWTEVWAGGPFGQQGPVHRGWAARAYHQDFRVLSRKA